eukprot:626055-Prymnesium_polylepis.1
MLTSTPRQPHIRRGPTKAVKRPRRTHCPQWFTEPCGAIYAVEPPLRGRARTRALRIARPRCNPSPPSPLPPALLLLGLCATSFWPCAPGGGCHSPPARGRPHHP